ncbi:PmoA family protein [candidate division KSB1 bacterium]|nr:PmoA family protein [candidate division KSB1 bacterium]
MSMVNEQALLTTRKRNLFPIQSSYLWLEWLRFWQDGGHMRILSLCLILVVALLFCTVRQKSIILYQQSDQGVLFTENGANVLFYQRTPKSFDGQYTRNNYVHPLWSLDGDTLTEDYPPDHAHHRGIFWTWHRIYAGDVALGDAWECRDFLWDVTDVQIEDGPDGAKALAAIVLWKSPDFVDGDGQMIAAVRESTRVTIHPRSADCRAIDFDISLLALQQNVRIGGADDVKGYGGFSPRIKCPDDLMFFSSTGQVVPKNEPVEAGSWLNMLASFDGEHRFGFAMLNHPNNPAPINRWILRQSRSMQNPVYPGRDLVAVSQNIPTVLKYRIIVHRGDADIARLYADYK